MLKYEFRKFLTNKFFFFLLCVFTIINLCYIKSQIIPENSVQELEVYSKIKGPNINEKVSAFVKEVQQADQTNPYYGIYLDDYDALEYAYNYEENIQQVIKKAENNVENAKLDSFEKKKNKQITRYYSHRKLEAFYHMEDEKALLEYDFSQGIILIFLLLGVPYIRVYERKGGMDRLSATCSHGQWQVRGAKTAFLAVLTLILSVFFSITDLIGFAVFGDLDGLGQPLYAISDFCFTPVHMKIIAFFFVSILIRFVGNLVIAFLIYICSAIFSNVLLIFISGGLITAAFVLITVYTSFSFSPVLLIKNSVLFKEYSAVNIGGFPLLMIYILLLLYTGINIVMAFVIIKGKRDAVSR